MNGFGSADSTSIKLFPSVKDPRLSSVLPIDLLTIKEAGQSVMLWEIKIVEKKDNQIYDDAPLYDYAEQNLCGDYVCRYGVLNCPNHRSEPDNNAPIIGNYYYTPVKGRIKYKGCTVIPGASSMGIECISYPKEFYFSDYSKFKIDEPEYISTIFWKPLVYVDSKGEASLSFYTSDLIR